MKATQKWFCPACDTTEVDQQLDDDDLDATPTSIVTNNIHNPDVANFSLLLSEIRGIKEKVNKIDDIEKSQSFIANQFDDIKNELKKLNALETDVKKIKKDNGLLHAKVADNQMQLTMLESAITNTQLIMENIPALAGEDLKAIFYKISDKLGVPQASPHIVDIKRLGKRLSTPDDDNRPPPILVQLQSVDLRNLVLTKRRETAILRTNECDPKGQNFGFQSTKTVYINPDYPMRVKNLFFEARSLKKDTKINYVFVKGLKVMAKLNKDDDPFEITDSTHISTLKEQHKKK
jgi:hypothetical protein